MKKSLDRLVEKSIQKDQSQMLLLEATNNRDKTHREVLEQLGWNQHIRLEEEQMNNIAERVLLQEELGNVLDLDTLLEICISKGYVIINYNNYTGPVSKTLSDQIVELLRQKDLTVQQTSGLLNFHIMCPIEYTDVRKRVEKTPQPVLLLWEETRHKGGKRFFKVYSEFGKASFGTMIHRKMISFLRHNATFDTTKDIYQVFLLILLIVCALYNGIMPFVIPESGEVFAFPYIIIVLSTTLSTIFSVLALIPDDSDYNRYKKYSFEYITNNLRETFRYDINIPKAVINCFLIRISITVLLFISTCFLMFMPFRTYHNNKSIKTNGIYRQIDGNHLTPIYKWKNY